MRIAWAAVVLLACGTSPPTPMVARAPVPTGPSCALPAPVRTKAPMQLREWIGRVGDRSWVLAAIDRSLVLVALDDDGTLATTKLPGGADDKLTVSIDGTHLWLDIDLPGKRRSETLYDIELAGAHPSVRRAESLTQKTLWGTSSFGVSATRGLFFTFAGHQGLQLWDREKHAPIVSEPLDLIGLDPPPIRCMRDRCFALAVVGDGPTRRLTSIQFSATGAVTREQLADDHLAEHVLIPDGDRTIAVWTSYSRRGLFARTLGATGAAAGPEVTLVEGHASDPQLVRADPPRVAYRDDAGWQIATLAPDRHSLVDTRGIGFRDASFLTAATTDDGTLATAFTSDVSIDMPVPPTTASAVWLAPSGEPAPPLDLMAGGKRTAMVPFPLVAPARAAVLVISQGHEPAGELVGLRGPCPR